MNTSTQSDSDDVRMKTMRCKSVGKQRDGRKPSEGSQVKEGEAMVELFNQTVDQTRQTLARRMLL
ncbi:hypothetical protein E2C01_012356 [Portunus trituberculatus]|uniref:Uncharacterized protein n=1 Tax=Portunus trituberculatus TaxID=210409 RepID=A0A5B7DDF1_PORTR|nr:hypothetical protein [Portunus trituberculatus]